MSPKLNTGRLDSKFTFLIAILDCSLSLKLSELLDLGTMEVQPTLLKVYHLALIDSDLVMKLEKFQLGMGGVRFKFGSTVYLISSQPSPFSYMI